MVILLQVLLKENLFAEFWTNSDGCVTDDRWGFLLFLD
jgi:hypothetical protein